MRNLLSIAFRNFILPVPPPFILHQRIDNGHRISFFDRRHFTILAYSWFLKMAPVTMSTSTNGVYITQNTGCFRFLVSGFIFNYRSQADAITFRKIIYFLKIPEIFFTIFFPQENGISVSADLPKTVSVVKRKQMHPCVMWCQRK